MKNKAMKVAIHPIFLFLIFIFVGRLCAHILHYRKTFVSAESLEISILTTIVIIVLLSIGYGFLICASMRPKKEVTPRRLDKQEEE